MSRPPRLTSLQALMRGWAELAPYNFIHALRLPGPPDLARWQRAAEEALRPLGLAEGGVEIELARVDLETQLGAELNRPFPPAARPLRFFVIEASAGDHWLGAVIDHWLADDFSCRALLERMHASYYGLTAREVLPPLAWAKPAAPPRVRLGDWVEIFRQAGRFRKAGRVPQRDRFDLRAETFRIQLAAEALPAIRALAHQHQATVHDLFLAAALQACGAAWKPEAGGSRAGVAVTSAMDLRRFSAAPTENGFGLLISQYTILEANPRTQTLPELLGRIAPQTRVLKATPGTAILAPAVVLSRLTLRRRSKITLFQRGAPLAAGLSNVNLTESWAERAGVADYRRVAPTGPVVPLVLMITTLHGRVSIDVTFRTAAFTREKATRLLEDFAQRLPSGAS